MNFIGQFVFVSWHGRLLQAYTNGEMHASQEVQNAGEEERWNVYALPNGKVSLQNFRTNLWFCAEPSGRAICDRTQPSEWEQWSLFAIGDGVRVGLKNHHDKWLCAQPPEDDTQFGGEVIADRVNCSDWERFSMIPSAGIPVQNQSWWDDALKVVKVIGDIAPIISAAS
jgi:hypothetical protein